MKRIMRAKNKVTLLFLSAILLLCIGFIFVACGVGPVTKGVNNDRGQYAFDFLTNCPAGRVCALSVEASDTAYDPNTIQAKPLTLEAWIKPKATSSAFILQHLESRGAALKTAAVPSTTSCDNATPTVFSYLAAHEAIVGQPLLAANSVGNCGITAGNTYYVCSVPNAFTLTLDDTSAACASVIGTQTGSTDDVDWGGSTMVAPMFQIRRVVVSAKVPELTSSVSYTIAAPVIALNAWTHVAGILSNDIHTVADHAACTDGTGAESDPWHMDIYINGVYSDCTETYGGNTDYTGGGAEADPTAAADAYAHAPGAKTISINAKAIIDDTRIWTTDNRTILDCMSQELGTSGTCDRTDSNLLSYLRFNAGAGSSVMDEAGVFGNGGIVYPVGNDVFISFEDGWTTDTPF